MKPPLEREFSAGGVVVRRMRGRDYVAVVRVKDGSVIALPKGHPEEGESMKEAAQREVREETGIDAVDPDKLGDVKYWYARDGKRIFKLVSFFLFRYAGGTITPQEEEVVGAEWLPLAGAPEALAYRGEREMAAKALERLRDRS
ncbi:MAG: NUDIX hydrolase [Thermoleophilaceae bacterium]|nr:NUDIX hydrolase [Thermoleophilaceae bacterium]